MNELTASTLDGPRVEPASGAPATALVVLLHGLGADGGDLITLSLAWAGVLPGAAFVAPNAPQPCDMAPIGRQWFSLQRRTPALMRAGVEAAAPALDAFLDHELAARGLDGARLVLMGFSQGASMALHVGLRRATAPAAILAYSGWLVAPELLARELRARPPVLLVHGDSDEIVPMQALSAATAGLESAGVSAEPHLRPGLGHGIDEEGLKLGADFLARHLPSA